MAKNSSTEQFSLRWNNFSNNLTTGFLSHLTENDLVDVTLAVEGQLLRAHKLVLSVCSPYFKSIFKENPCQHPVIILKDVKYVEIESLLKFMYQGEINVKQEELPTLLKVAQTLQIKGLATEEDEEEEEEEEEEDMKFLHNCESQATVRSDIHEIIAQSHSNTSKAGKDTEIMDRRKRSRDLTRRSSKRKKLVSPVSENVQTATKSEEDKDQEILLLSNEDSDATDQEESSSNSSLSKNDELSKKEQLGGPSSVQIIEDNCTPAVVEPVTYRLSTRGRPQLVHEGYVYNLTSRSEGLNRSHYRCAEQHRGCKGKCAVIAERFMPTGVHDHNHPPGYQSEQDYRKKKGLDVDS